MQKNTHTERGGITLLTLMMLVLFIIIFGASSRWIARQSRGTVEQEQEEQAFGLADTGINYTSWLLLPMPRGGGLDPVGLVG